MLKKCTFSHELTSGCLEIRSQVIRAIQQTSLLLPESIACCCGITYMSMPDGNTKKVYKQGYYLFSWYIFLFWRILFMHGKYHLLLPQISAVRHVLHFYSNLNERKVHFFQILWRTLWLLECINDAEVF